MVQKSDTDRDKDEGSSLHPGSYANALSAGELLQL